MIKITLLLRMTLYWKFWDHYNSVVKTTTEHTAESALTAIYT